MHALLLASVTDKVVEPIVDVATEFIGSAGVVALFPLLALQRLHLARLDPVGPGAGDRRRKGRRQLGTVAPQARLPRLPGPGRHRHRDRLPDREAAAFIVAGLRLRSGQAEPPEA